MTSSRYDLVSRRAFLRRAGALGGVLLIPGLAACGESDADAFATATTTAAATATTTASPGATTTTSGGTDATATPSTTAAANDALPSAAELAITFTYAAASSGGRVHNPYIAVWIEDASGELVQTVALWFKQQRGDRWLSDLRRWYEVDGSDETIDTVSSATRVAGEYSLVWDGTDLDGATVAQGEYHVCIEAAREHGPYSLIREPVTLGAEGFSTDLEPDEELTDAAVEFVV